MSLDKIEAKSHEQIEKRKQSRKSTLAIEGDTQTDDQHYIPPSSPTAWP